MERASWCSSRTSDSEKPEARWDDRRIAEQLQEEVDLIVGAHSHDLLPEGERVGRVLITQAGAFGEHVGRIEIDGGSISASVAPVGGDVEPSPLVEEEAARIEAEVEELLADELGSIETELDAGWIADLLRRRMGTEVGLFSDGLTLGVLPPGPVTRGALFGVSETGANPACHDHDGRADRRRGRAGQRSSVRGGDSPVAPGTQAREHPPART